MKFLRITAALLVLLLLGASTAHAFCGFYVARADTKLFNRASKVVLVRDGERTVLTMANDYQGDPQEFAVVIPVPTFLEREQIHVAEPALIDHLDAYTAPRLVEYFDDNPCSPMLRMMEKRLMSTQSAAAPEAAPRSDRSLGVTVEATYNVGEYDIAILSAEESDGLETWLRRNGYRIPDGAGRVLGSYIRQGLRFFVARVDLSEKKRLGYSYLRPLQVAYESPRFMLPIRLGTINADGPQELFAFVLTRTGRVETTNYRTVRLPSDVELPVYIKDDFAQFYRDMFARQVEEERMRTVFLEYAWDMNWCDPCAADPLSPAELRELGVFWIDRDLTRDNRRMRPQPPARDVYVTRLHLRYTADTFPEDLRFQETGDRTNFQGRYILRHAFDGAMSCPRAASYRQEVSRRQREEAQNLARLTGWKIGEIHQQMSLPAEAEQEAEETPWWKKLWGGSESRGR